MKLLVPRAVAGISETPRANRARCLGTLRIQQTRATTNSNHFRFANKGQILIPAWVLWEFHLENGRFTKKQGKKNSKIFAGNTSFKGTLGLGDLTSPSCRLS